MRAEAGDKNLAQNSRAFSLESKIFCLPALVRLQNHIHQYGPPVSIEGQGVLILAPAQDVFGQDTGEDLHGLVPYHHLSVQVYGHYGLGQEADDVRHLLLRLFQGLLGSLARGDIPGGVGYVDQISFPVKDRTGNGLNPPA